MTAGAQTLLIWVLAIGSTLGVLGMLAWWIIINDSEGGIVLCLLVWGVMAIACLLVMAVDALLVGGFSCASSV